MNRFLTLIAMLLASGFASAQEVVGTCDEGHGLMVVVSPGVIDCMPNFHGTKPNDSAGPAGPAAPQWETRWGAIALGGGGFGAVNDVISRRAAEKQALKGCRDTGGGKKCKISVTYYNQCAASATGASKAATFTAADKEEAELNALKNCNAQDSNCEVFYSACSYPVLIQ